MSTSLVDTTSTSFNYPKLLIQKNDKNDKNESISSLNRPLKRSRKESPSQQHIRKEKMPTNIFNVPMTSSTDDNTKVELPLIQSSKSEHFTLLSQPKPLQRKSYRNERRYLLPNPITVIYIGDPSAGIVGTVEVFLVDDAGVLLPKEMQDMLEGVKFKSFDDQNRAAFSLLMRTISGDMNVRLKFVIRYKVTPHSGKTASTDCSADCVEYKEEFMSNAFRVESNRKKPLADHPCLISIDPCEGPRNVNQEVLLHGANFGDGKNIRVRFGGFPVAVASVDKDTITIVAPVRPDLQPNSRVAVQVGQSHPTRGVIWRPEALFYTYLGDKEIKQPATILLKTPCFPSVIPQSFATECSTVTPYFPQPSLLQSLQRVAVTPSLSRSNSMTEHEPLFYCNALQNLAATVAMLEDGRKQLEPEAV